MRRGPGKGWHGNLSDLAEPLPSIPCELLRLEPNCCVPTTPERDRDERASPDYRLLSRGEILAALLANNCTRGRRLRKLCAKWHGHLAPEEWFEIWPPQRLCL